MNKTQFASYCLIASAFVLTAVLVASFDKDIAVSTTAEAQYIVDSDDFTLMSADIREGEEGLFVLDNNLSRILIYRARPEDPSLRLVNQLDLTQIFRSGARTATESENNSGARETNTRQYRR